MSALPTRIEREAGRSLTPLQIFDITARRETRVSCLLMLYISTGLLFILVPGTFLGVWNLLAISSHRAAESVSPMDGRVARDTGGLRPTLSSSSDLGISSPPRLGIQRQVAYGFLGLRPVRGRVLWLAVALNSAGVLAAFAGWMMAASLLLIVAFATAVYSLRLFEKPARPAKIRGVHTSFPAFVRLAYLWALIAAGLGIWAATRQNPHGIWGASRHALTVGFLASFVSLRITFF